ncbi:MAG: M28 family peptidase [Candidatus Hermodarchaeota archaeon]
MIDQNRILENLNELSFPRLSGTEFEKKAFNLVKKKIENQGISPSFQEFSFSIFFSRLYPKIALTLLSWLLLVLFLDLHIIFSLANLMLTLIFIIFLIIFTRAPEAIKIGHKYHSQNLYVKISSKNKVEGSDYNILLFSHIDSKGQTFSIKLRINLYYLWVITYPLGLIITIIHFIILPLTIIVLQTLGILVIGLNIMATFFLWLNRTNNKSNGAIDNASGMSCVLEILHYFSNQKNMLKNYNLWFVFTGAEESGTMGVRNFYRYIKDFEREKTFIANFDSFANQINIWDHGLLNNKNYKVFNYIRENNEIMILEKKTRKFYIGLYSDGLFLYNKDFQGLGAGDRSVHSYVHSIHDDVDKIDIKILKSLCEFYTILLKDIDDDIKNTESAN